MLRCGRTEDDINREIFDLAAAQFGTRKYWHVRLVRTGENTIHPIHVKAPDRVLQDDDIAFIDLGPVFENVEADFARNYVIGKPHFTPVLLLFTTRDITGLFVTIEHCISRKFEPKAVV